MAVDLHRRRIPEHAPTVRGAGRTGRHVLHDPRSREFPAEAAAELVSVVHPATGLPLFQSRGSCTAEACDGAMDAAPNFKGRVLTQADADALYDAEIIEEGGDPKVDDPGGSGLMVCRAAKKMGLVGYYRHAFGLDHALRALVKRPVMVGVNWYTSFDRPGPNGVVDLPSSASIRGGHEFVLLRLIVEHELVGCAQSWGPDWGVPDPEMGLPKGGVFYVPFAILERLLGEEGDATVPYPPRAS